jgi:cobalt-zinc-cadmium efflux system outer membrane protein
MHALLLFALQMRPVSFETARALAEQAAGDVIVAERRVDVARGEVGVAGTLANPSVSVLTARQTAQIGVGLTVPLPLFGQRGTAVAAARADLDVAGFEVVVSRNDARWNATVAWFDLWEAQQRARVLILAAEESSRLLSIAKQRFDAGSAPRLDVVRATADDARARSEAGSARAAILAAGARLSPWLGEPSEAPLEAQGQGGFPLSLPAIGTLVEAAANHPILVRDRGESSAAEAHVRAEQRQRWPVVNGELTVNYGDPTLPGTDVIGGAAFELPVLSLRGGAIARARAQQAVAEATAVADARRLFAELRDAFHRAEGGIERERALRESVLPAIEEARKMTEEGYRAGRVDLLRLLEAQRAVLDTRLALAEASAALGRAQADLERASGRRLDAK